MSFGRTTHTDPRELIESEAAAFEKAAKEADDRVDELEAEAALLRTKATTARQVAQRYREALQTGQLPPPAARKVPRTEGA